MKVTILNTSILTNFGEFIYESVTTEEAKDLISDGFISAVGHQSTATVISQLLGTEVNPDRIQYDQQPGDVALVFKLNGRAPEGTIMSVEEIEAMGYSFGVLKRVR